MPSELNLYDLYKFAIATEIPTINFVVLGGPQPDGGTVVGASAGEFSSMLIPDATFWTWAPTINLTVEPGGVIAGRAGDGGNGSGVGGSGFNYPAITGLYGSAGARGWTGLKVQYPINLDNRGIIGGGGGGGGGGGATGRRNTDGTYTLNFAGGGGGGGAGALAGDGGDSIFKASNVGQLGNGPSLPNNNGQDGTTTAAGEGGRSITTLELFGFEYLLNVKQVSGKGGRGGALGQSGEPGGKASYQTIGFTDAFAVEGFGGVGGLPGFAIEGVTNVTFINRGDIRGVTI